MNITLEKFINNLCGQFNNDNQISDEMSKGNVAHPQAKHINCICNNKISNIPADFNGYFVLEESYYVQGNFKNIMPHLFLFTVNEENKIVLTSYEVPKNIDKKDFTNSNDNLSMDYNELIISEKFTPMVYEEKDDIFYGESESNFSPEITFTLKETIKEDTLYVSEVMRRNGKITFGFTDPIIYKKIK